jgi:hypothetical protein
MWYGWHFDHKTGTWDRLCEDVAIDDCWRQLVALRPAARTNLHRAFTQGSYPGWLPPHPHGDGVRRDVK